MKSRNMNAFGKHMLKSIPIEMSRLQHGMGLERPCTMTGRSSTMMNKELKVSHSINVIPTLSFSVLFCIGK